ncbi:MAG: thymidine phosphorylase [Zetaproteobacteria bacterium]|nr:thymidine phosphorylase [Zetaproteobacteria bacterium]
MIPQQLIEKKRFGDRLADEELEWFFLRYLRGKVADYQMSAMLMAICTQGLDCQETAQLTQLMCQSGKQLDWPKQQGMRVVDKHSTGGVGDKVSLALFPLALSYGLKVPMMAGRGLGHTGGTIDKLEAIPGMRLDLTLARCRTLYRQHGGFLIEQSPQICPLDRRLYALRDVTGTVASVGLITASILSKKMAAGVQGLVMDVKAGSGAFFATRREARVLAQRLVATAQQLGMKVDAYLSDMNSPLGRTAGNALEVNAALAVLAGEGEEDVRKLVLELAARMATLADGQAKTTHLRGLRRCLDGGAALEQFRRWVQRQGGKLASKEVPYLPVAAKTAEVLATTAGVVQRCDVKRLGQAVVALGGGRTQLGQMINPRVGLSQLLHVGEVASPSTPLAVIHGQKNLAEVKAMVRAAYKLGA